MRCSRGGCNPLCPPPCVLYCVNKSFCFLVSYLYWQKFACVFLWQRNQGQQGNYNMKYDAWILNKRLEGCVLTFQGIWTPNKEKCDYFAQTTFFIICFFLLIFMYVIYIHTYIAELFCRSAYHFVCQSVFCNKIQRRSLCMSLSESNRIHTPI